MGINDTVLSFAVLRIYKDSKGQTYVNTESGINDFDFAMKRAKDYRRRLNSNWQVAVASVEMHIKERLVK